jgi:two-component system LytT family response regulator
MNTLQALVVDDEKPARTRLIELLQREPGMETADAAEAYEAIELIRARRPDLLFLDIQMPGLDGFGVLREIGPEAMPVTIFVTAYDRYAIQAFEAHALDYLLKPFSDERFEAALRRARKQLQTQAASEIGLKFTALLGEHAAAPPASYVERIVLKSNGRVTFLDAGEIDWIEAAGVYVYLHAGPKAHLYRATVGQMEQRLDPRQFVRVHRSAMVNTSRIRELQARSHGDYIVVLKSGTEVPLSRGYRSNLEGWLRQSL